MTDRSGALEDLAAFRLRARAWIARNLRPLEDTDWEPDETARWQRTRRVQRTLFDGGFAGLCFPKEYGGQGLSGAYQRVFDEETAAYELPVLINVPTLGIIAPTILESGSEAQKKRYLPKILSGEEVWVQFLSEPAGGSDLASVITRATRSGDDFILNGSKVWSSGAYAADYALCVARTNWDVPKHDGISVLIVKIDQPGVRVDRIVGVAGDREFCQEFFDDVRIPAENVVGPVDGGWSVVRGLLANERKSMGGGSIYVPGARRTPTLRQARAGARGLAEATGTTGDPRVRQLVAEEHVLGIVFDHLSRHVAAGMATGHYPPPASALLRLMGARNGVRRTDIALEIAGSSAGAWRSGDPTGDAGLAFLGRQGSELGGGSTEMQRNIISERLLEMPREYAADRGVPFKDVSRNATPKRR